MHVRTRFEVDPEVLKLRGVLLDRLEDSARAVDADVFASIAEPLWDTVLRRGFEGVGAHEGTIWLTDADGEHLVPAVNTGGHAAQLVGKFKQPLGKGIISMVYASEQPYCENDVYQSEQHDGTLNESLGLVTCALMAVPFYFASALRGVVSCVQLKQLDSEEPDPAGFSGLATSRLAETATLLERLVNHRLYSLCLGLEHD
jgi:hypothetical protein